MLTTQLRGQIYIASYAVGFALFVLITVFRRKTYKTGLLRAVIYSFITFLSGFCGAAIIGPPYNFLAGLKGFFPAVFVDVLGAVIFTAPLLLAAVYTEKAILKNRIRKAETATGAPFQPWPVSFRDTMDLVIPGAFIVFAFIKIGCSFRGCCWGVEWSWGFTAQFMYSKTVFPVQAFESASLFAVSIVSILIQRAPFYRRGMSGPFAALLYGILRFCWEFFRWGPPEMHHYFLGLTIWQLFCFPIWIVAGVWIYILIKKQPCEPRSNTISLLQKTKSLMHTVDSIRAKRRKSAKKTNKQKQIVHHTKKRRK